MTNLSDYFQTAPVVVEFVNATEVNYDTTGDVTVTIPVPEGIAENDFVVIIGLTRNSFIGEPEGGGWTEVFELGVLNNGTSPDDPIAAGNEQCIAWYKLASGSEPANYDFLINDDGIDGQILHCMVFRNALSIADYAADGAKIAPSVDLITGDILLTFHGASFSTSSDATIISPTGMPLIDKQYNSTGDCGAGIAYEKIFTDGASGTRTWTSSWAGTDTVISVNMIIR